MFNRNITIVINWILENILPPFARDWYWLMYVIIYPVYGKHTRLIMDFKKNLPNLSTEEISSYYTIIKDAPINKRPTDLNGKCLDYILNNIVGQSVIDCGCGRGFLVEQLSKLDLKNVYGADIELPNTPAINELQQSKTTCVRLVKSSIEDLSLDTSSIDTVLCTHTLEHIINYKNTIDNLIRICKNRLIIVMPCQRNYKYTPDLHVHFLPYLHDFERFIGISGARYFKLGGDFVCVYDKV